MRGGSSADPIFIVGYMHSGTSMLQNALGSHSEVFSSDGETKYFDFLPMTRERFADLSRDDVLRALIDHCAESIRGGLSLRAPGEPGSAMAGLDAREIEEIARTIEVRDHAAIFGVVMSYMAARAGKQRWLEKTPTHIFAVDTILKAIPNARFVEIVRDPRDVLSSKKTRRDTVWTTRRYSDTVRAFKHLEKAYDPLWDALSWKAAARAGLGGTQKHPERWVRVRYEDLVRDPDRELRRICDAIGMSFEPHMIDVPGGQPASDDALGRRARGIATDSIERWRTTLEPSELAVIQAVTASELRALGYAQAPTTASASVGAVPVLAHSAAEFFIRLRRRQQMGGARFMALVLGNYLRRARRMISG